MGNEYEAILALIESEVIALIAVTRHVLMRTAVDHTVHDLDLVIAGALQKQGLNILRMGENR